MRIIIKSKKDIKLFVIVTIVVIIVFGIKGWRDILLLRNNVEKVKAVICEIYTVRYSDYYKYVFTVNGKIYKGKGACTNFLSVGDTIVIIYEKTNPKNNRPE